ERSQLSKLLERAEAAIVQMEQNLQKESAQDDTGEYRLPEALVDARQRRTKIRQSQAKLEASERKAMLPDEPQARQMKCRDGIRWSYNAQAVVEGDSGIVVAQALTEEVNDERQLVPMLEQVRENLCEKTAEHTLADAGYATQEQLGRA